MSKPKSKFQGLFEIPSRQPEQPVGEQVVQTDTGEETLEERNQACKKSRKRKEENQVARVKTNYEIRQDYVRALKRIAVDEERKIYEVIEDAIAEYLERHKQNFCHK
jgi:hypothetical protein